MIRRKHLKARIEYLEKQLLMLNTSYEWLHTNQPAQGSNRKKLDRYQVSDIRALHFTGIKNAELAKMFKVNPATISRIVRGLYYKETPVQGECA